LASAEVERSIPQGAPANGAPAGEPEQAATATADTTGYRNLLVGTALIVISFLAYYLIHPERSNLYLHFVLQAQAWLEGNTTIPMPGYQDVMPVLNSSGQETGRGIIPFPPLPAWVIVPFVAVWHEATDQQMLSKILGAVDVGIAYWMLGYLPVRPAIRLLTAVFLGLGSVLWYTSAIGSTWFWAHIVAVACLLLSVGLALKADREATEPRSVADLLAAVRGFAIPGGLATVGLVVAAGASTAILFLLADSGSAAAVVALVGLAIAALAAALAVSAAGRLDVVSAFAAPLLVVGGLPAIVLLAYGSLMVSLFVDVMVVALILVVWASSLRAPESFDRALGRISAALSSPEALQVAAGILFGLAVMARLTILFGFPFLILVGGGGNWVRRGLLAGAGAAVPITALLVATYATSGQLFNPAYDYLYHVELKSLGGVLDYNSSWSISDVRYVPQNLMIMLFGAPEIGPNFVGVYGPNFGDPVCVGTAARGLFDQTCPLAIPDAVGTSILLASPAFLVAPFAWRPLRDVRIDRATAGATIAVLTIAFVNLMHFSQGWVQFGYRFSNDFVPFALILVALGASRIGRLWPFVVLVALSIAINFWGTMWGSILGW
jgi:hypothetical protein